jgi:hypothetical protein
MNISTKTPTTNSERITGPVSRITHHGSGACLDAAQQGGFTCPPSRLTTSDQIRVILHSYEHPPPYTALHHVAPGCTDFARVPDRAAGQSLQRISRDFKVFQSISNQKTLGAKTWLSSASRYAPPCGARHQNIEIELATA